MKILVIDDHVLIRDAVRGVLSELNAEAIVREAADWRQAARQMEQTADFDLVLLDLKLPDRDGFEVLAELRQRFPAISVVVLSAHNDAQNVAKALDLGALGFIPKSSPREVMLSAFNLIFSGGMYIPPEILLHKEAPQGRVAARIPAADLGLTERQIQVLGLMMQGRSNKAICRALLLAEPTVKNHVTAILKALKASNRTEAVITAGTLDLGPDRKVEPASVKRTAQVRRKQSLP
jgi:DNA-binding NarL/FixJ family response regulator